MEPKPEEMFARAMERLGRLEEMAKPTLHKLAELEKRADACLKENEELKRKLGEAQKAVDDGHAARHAMSKVIAQRIATQVELDELKMYVRTLEATILVLGEESEEQNVKQG